MTTLAMFGMPGGMEMVIILVIGLLLFGRRLPEVGRSLGKSIVEFKKGVKGIEDEIESASTPDAELRKPEKLDSAAAPPQPIESAEPKPPDGLAREPGTRDLTLSAPATHQSRPRYPAGSLRTAHHPARSTP